MNVCFAASECVPFVKIGGLADVCGALPKALAEQGCAVRVFLPLYSAISVHDHGLHRAEGLQGLTAPVGDQSHPFDVWHGRLPDADVEVYFIDCPYFFHRSWPYTHDHDEPERFILFQHAVFRTLQQMQWAPDVLHVHDWPTGLMPLYLRRHYGWDRLFEGTASVYTLHNLGDSYQGRFDPGFVQAAGLSGDDFYPMGPLELYGTFSFMKAGLVHADAVSTVSERYAEEIRTPMYGHGLEGVLQSRRDDLYGIVNGIDPSIWSPADDELLPHHYTRDDLSGKTRNKEALAGALDLPYRPRTPIVGIISRFVKQKGFGLLQPILGDLLARHDVQFAVLGSGEQPLEDFFKWAAAAFPGRVGFFLGYSEPLAHLIEAGADLFLMPSIYEPCGLNQMYSLAYGTLPLVHHTGGLADIVADFHEHPDRANGFSFHDHTPEALFSTFQRALHVYHNDPTAWQTLVARGMAQDFSWSNSARKYVRLYENAIQHHRF